MRDLVSLSDKYECKEFLIGDPSWFMHQVEGDTNRELLAFIASALSYGSRTQFMPKIQYILDCTEGDVKSWLLTRKYEADIPRNEKCFYRLYTFAMMHDFLKALAWIVYEYGSIKEYVRTKLCDVPKPENSKIQCIDVIRLITDWFREHNSKGVIPKDAKSSCKRLCMFMRWMVREDSPVDLGLWSDIVDVRSLIIPLDTHVMQEAHEMGLLQNKTASMATALSLTNKFREIFPDDPLKGDFALFGYGVNKEK